MNKKGAFKITNLIFAILFTGISLAEAKGPFEDLRFHERLRKGEKHLGGARAVEALGKDLERVAQHYGLSASDLSHRFKTERTLKINPDALLFFADALPEEASPGNGIPNNPAPATILDGDVFKLHSKPGSTRIVYLNFQGATTSNTSWNVNGPIVSAPFNFNGDDPNTFSTAELQAIKAIWIAVAEDYSPFNVDITTERPSTIPVPNRYQQVIISSTSAWYGNAGGVSFINSITWGDGTPNFVFSSLLNNNIKYVAEATSHETGHALGLYHWSTWDSSGTLISEYHAGHNFPTIPSGWAPIMGVGYYKNVVTWSKGEYPYGKNSLGSTQDDVATISGLLGYATDEAGATRASAAIPNKTTANGVATLDHLGVISTPSDVDLYKIDTIGGDLNVTSETLYNNTSNLDAKLRLLNSSGAELAVSDPDGVAPATISMTGLASGTYYLEVSSSSYLSFSQSGYSTYGSIGQYHLAGTYPVTGGASPTSTPAPTPTATPTPTPTRAPTATPTPTPTRAPTATPTPTPTLPAVPTSTPAPTSTPVPTPTTPPVPTPTPPFPTPTPTPTAGSCRDGWNSIGCGTNKRMVRKVQIR